MSFLKKNMKLMSKLRVDAPPHLLTRPPFLAMPY